MKLRYKNQIVQKIIGILLFSIASFAQENSAKTQEQLLPSGKTFSLYFVLPNQIGNHTLAEDYKNKFGLGAKLTLFRIKNFNLGAGGEYTTYRVSNRSNAGNFNRGTYKNAFLLVNYPIQVLPKFTLTPVAAIGVLEFSQRERAIRHSHQGGQNYRLGFSTDYELTTNTDVFLGIEYIYTKFKLQANPEILDYYGKSANVQLSFGIRFKTAKKSSE